MRHVRERDMPHLSMRIVINASTFTLSSISTRSQARWTSMSELDIRGEPHTAALLDHPVLIVVGGTRSGSFIDVLDRILVEYVVHGEIQRYRLVDAISAADVRQGQRFVIAL